MLPAAKRAKKQLPDLVHFTQLKRLGNGTFGQAFLCEDVTGFRFVAKQIRLDLDSDLTDFLLTGHDEVLEPARRYDAHKLQRFVVINIADDDRYIQLNNTLNTMTEDLTEPEAPSHASPVKNVYKEFKTMQRLLNVPNIPKLYDLKIYPEFNVAHIYMEHITGESLFDWLTAERPNPLPEAKLRPLFLQLLNALHCMHIEGVYHGDIKPDNIVLSADKKTAYLVDFGWAHRRHTEDIQYLIPSRADGLSPSRILMIDRARRGLCTSVSLTHDMLGSQDVWKLALVFWRCLTQTDFIGDVYKAGTPEEDPEQFLKQFGTRGNIHWRWFLGELLVSDFKAFDRVNNRIKIQTNLSCEMQDFMTRMMQPDDELRPSTLELLNHRVFWEVKTRKIDTTSAAELARKRKIRILPLDEEEDEDEVVPKARSGLPTQSLQTGAPLVFSIPLNVVFFCDGAVRMYQNPETGNFDPPVSEQELLEAFQPVFADSSDSVRFVFADGTPYSLEALRIQEQTNKNLRQKIYAVGLAGFGPTGAEDLEWADQLRELLVNYDEHPIQQITLTTNLLLEYVRNILFERHKAQLVAATAMFASRGKDLVDDFIVPRKLTLAYESLKTLCLETTETYYQELQEWEEHDLFDAQSYRAFRAQINRAIVLNVNVVKLMREIDLAYLDAMQNL